MFIIISEFEQQFLSHIPCFQWDSTCYSCLYTVWHFLTVVGYTSPLKWLMFFPTIREASGWRWHSPGAKSGPVDPQWAPSELREVSKNHGLCLAPIAWPSGPRNWWSEDEQWRWTFAGLLWTCNLKSPFFKVVRIAQNHTPRIAKEC